MSQPTTQTAIVQLDARSSSSLPVGIAQGIQIPAIREQHDVLIRVKAVALNPTDFKMVTYFPAPPEWRNPVGCDFCGTVEDGDRAMLAVLPKGTLVCGAVFPYGSSRSVDTAISGAFAEWVVADARQLLCVPKDWTAAQGAAIGATGWGTCALSLFADPDALALAGRPRSPVAKKTPVLVYGGATATGTMACQLLSLSGYEPVAVTSEASAQLATDYGASSVVRYTSPSCVKDIKAATHGSGPIHHALDCITTAESASTCLAAMARAGGRYACLEEMQEAWKTRKAVRTKEVMGFEAFGRAITLGSGTYSRPANVLLLQAGIQWAAEMQVLVDEGKIRSHPIQELPGSWDGIIKGLAMLQTGQVRGKKLVVSLSPVGGHRSGHGIA